MKIEFSVSECVHSEETVLGMIEKDWGVKRLPRAKKPHFSFYDATDYKYSVATIISPKEHEGKFVGYSGVGKYKDLFVDAGTFVVGGAFSEKNGLPDFRDNGVSTRVRNVRDAHSESLSQNGNKPYCIIVIAGPNGYTRFLESKGYETFSKKIPEWAIERIGNKYYIVYNENDEPMKKAWDILKIMQPPKINNLKLSPPKSKGHQPKIKDMNLQYQISSDKDETCDYCHRPAVLDCKACNQKLCQRHLNKPCTTGDGDYRYG